MERTIIQLSEEECNAFAEAIIEYKEANWVCDASKARLLANMSSKWLL